MPAPLQIRELPFGISAKVKKPGRMGIAMIILGFGVIVVYLAFRIPGESSLLIAGTIGAGLLVSYPTGPPGR